LIEIRRIDHVSLRVADPTEASARWAIQFGLTERSSGAARALLACDYEPYSIELVESRKPGHDHTGFELRKGCSLEHAAAHLEHCGTAF
jgi:hypothetical protein